jgi:hypothetical protein
MDPDRRLEADWAHRHFVVQYGDAGAGAAVAVHLPRHGHIMTSFGDQSERARGVSDQIDPAALACRQGRLLAGVGNFASTPIPCRHDHVPSNIAPKLTSVLGQKQSRRAHRTRRLVRHECDQQLSVDRVAASGAHERRRPVPDYA